MATVLTSARRNGNGTRIGVTVPSAVIRCAVYCRQSVSEGSAESASIAVQREACQNYIAAHKAEGWTAIPDAYVDQGISGATLQRPGMQRLLADIEADRVDAIVVYKLDRVSRNLADFTALVESLDQRGVRLVSITQSFDTKSAIGKLTLSILMSFAEFERTLISERTRDSIAAAKKKGKWCGGCAVFGFDIVEKKLVPNEIEAQRTREAFAIYLQTGSLIATAEQMNARGWRTKESATKTGARGNKPWNKGVLHGLLTNPILIGKVVSGGEAYDGNHPAIVDEATWTAVQDRLQSNAVAGSSGERHPSEALLAGILRCSLCGASMTPTHCKKGPRKYSFYACSRRVKGGKSACSAPYLSAPKIEAEYVARIAKRAGDPKVVEAVVSAARDQLAERKRSLADEARAVRKALKDADRERGAADCGSDSLDRRIRDLRARLAEIEGERSAADATTVEADQVAEMLRDDFAGVWGAMTSRERKRVVELTAERLFVRRETRNAAPAGTCPKANPITRTVV
ncbi:MAG: recombinase family protein [bacterium]